jgi:hypothetical protein
MIGKPAWKWCAVPGASHAPRKIREQLTSKSIQECPGDKAGAFARRYVPVQYSQRQRHKWRIRGRVAAWNNKESAGLRFDSHWLALPSASG